VRLPKNATIDDYLKTTTGEHPAYTDLTEEGTHGYALHPAARHMSPTEYADIVVTGHPNILKIKPEPGVNIFPNVPGIANEVIYPPGHKMTRTSDPWDKLIGDRFFGFNWGNPDVPAKAAEVLISKRRRPPRRTNMQEGGSVKDHCEGGMATISSMKRKYAAGGQTKGGDPVQAITDALAHLDQGDSSAALQALQRSPQAMQDPGIQAALGNMQKFAKGGKLSALKTYMVSYSLKSQPGGGGARIVRAISPKDARVRLEAQNSDHKVLGVDPWFNSAKSKAMDKAERIDPVKLAKGGKVNQIANIARMALKKGVTRNVTDYSDTDVNRLLKALRSRKPESGAARRIERHHQIAGDLLDDMYEGAEGSVDNWEAARGELKTLHGAMDRVAKVGKKVPKAKGGSVPGYAKAGRVLLTAAGKPKTWYHVSSASPEVVTTKLKAATPTAAKNEIEKQLLKNSRDFRPADRADKVLTSSPTHKEYRLPGDRRFRWTITSDKKKAEEAAKRYDSPGHSDDDLYDD
jgi:hypothetical protein